MKNTMALLLALTLALACKNEEKKNSSTNDIKKDKISMSKKDVCEYISVNDIANIMNWDASKLNKKQDFSFNRYNFSACTYTKMESSEFVMLKVYHKSEKAIANKMLENQRSNFILNGNQNYTYQEISGDGTQTILGTYSKRGFHYYHLKTRIENKYELSSEITTTEPNKGDIEKELQQLVKLLNK